ncbi:hypothetical protein TBK1r_50880 [Stieleria magnilauensis]|uniref:Uncharacterized protein n=1 Tax=Stieleria magnilauensis TaxID=2527963 RepID=A0ABX5XVL4_9BACT|nr:hypothetical protein TBK1r_50880 [Planctomycetes bacterium TBK1r]
MVSATSRHLRDPSAIWFVGILPAVARRFGEWNQLESGKCADLSWATCLAFDFLHPRLLEGIYFGGPFLTFLIRSTIATPHNQNATPDSPNAQERFVREHGCMLADE